MKRRINKPTIKKIAWLKDNYNKFRHKHELVEAMQKEFGGHPKRLTQTIKVFLGEKENTSSHYKRKVNNTKKEFCYFCNTVSELVGHHITYYPENLVTVCKTCHLKIHHLMKIQHNTEVERLTQIQKIKDLVKKW